MTTSELTNLADRHQERADRLAECSRQTAFRDSAADLIADAELHAETAAALREAGRPRGAAFENTERDRLAWRDRAWKAESERDAALAEVERLIADGQQDAPIVDDATRQEVPEVLVTFAKWADWYLDDGCRRDHHGYCQSHGLDKDCPVGPMREWLAAYLGRTD